MTSTAPPPSPVLPWHRTVAWTGLAWALCEMGACLTIVGPRLLSHEASFAYSAALTFFLLSALTTLLLPAGPLLLRRCLSLAVYQLAVVPAALGTLFFVYWLLALSMNVIYERDLDLVGMTLFLAASLARGAVAGALLSASRHRARMYGQRA